MQIVERCAALPIVPEWVLVTSRGSDHGSDPRGALQAGGQPDGERSDGVKASLGLGTMLCRTLKETMTCRPTRKAPLIK